MGEAVFETCEPASDGVVHQDMPLAEWPLENDPSESSGPRECDIGLAMGEAGGEIDHDFVKCLTLTLMNSNTPCQNERDLGVGADGLTVDPVLDLGIGELVHLPGILANLDCVTGLESDGDHGLALVCSADFLDSANRTINVFASRIIVGTHDLCAYFEGEIRRSRFCATGEVTGRRGVKSLLYIIQFFEHDCVIDTGRPIGACEVDRVLGRGREILWVKASVESDQMRICDGAGADGVEDLDKSRITLPIDLGEL